jgi:hypothetical protein
MHRRGENLGISILRRIVSCAALGKWYSDSARSAGWMDIPAVNILAEQTDIGRFVGCLTQDIDCS